MQESAEKAYHRVVKNPPLIPSKEDSNPEVLAPTSTANLAQERNDVDETKDQVIIQNGSAYDSDTLRAMGSNAEDTGTRRGYMATAELMDAGAVHQIYARNDRDHLPGHAEGGTYEYGEMRIDTSFGANTGFLMAHEAAHGANQIVRGHREERSSEDYQYMTEDHLQAARDIRGTYAEGDLDRDPADRHPAEIEVDTIAYAMMHPETMQDRYPDVYRDAQDVVDQVLADDSDSGEDAEGLDTAT